MFDFIFGRKKLLTYEGNTFSVGDRVHVNQYAGTTKPEKTGHEAEVDCEMGRQGTVIGKYKSISNDNWLLDVAWDAQTWRESAGGRRISLGPFEDLIHPCYLTHTTDGQVPVAKMECAGQLFVHGDRVRLSRAIYFTGDSCGHPELFGLDSCDEPLGMEGKAGQEGAFVRAVERYALVDWDAQEWEESETGRKLTLPAFTYQVPSTAIEHGKGA